MKCDLYCGHKQRHLIDGQNYLSAEFEVVSRFESTITIKVRWEKWQVSYKTTKHHVPYKMIQEGLCTLGRPDFLADAPVTFFGIFGGMHVWPLKRIWTRVVVFRNGLTIL